MDREAKARAIVEQARSARKPTPRWLWIASLAVALVCVGALAIGYLVGGGATTSPAPRAGVSAATGGVGGFGIGLVIGIGAGIAIGSVIGLRRRDRE